MRGYKPSMIPDRFQFSPLSNDSLAVRIFTIDGRDQQGYLDCSLNPTLIGHEEYIALSYMCGDQCANYSITLNYQAFWVRSNLYEILFHAVEHFICTYLWVDALCIAPDDFIEESRRSCS
jgi:hypothetical protein